MNLAKDGQRALGHGLAAEGDIEDILVLEGDISGSACHDAVEVDRDDAPGAILLHAMEHGTGLKGILGETAGILDDRTDGRIGSQVVHAGMEDGSLDLDRVLVTALDRVDDDGVAISQAELREVELLDLIGGVAVAGGAMHTDGILIGSVGKATGILQQGGDGLVGFHLIGHRALHKALDIHDALVGAYDDHIIVLQVDIACQFAIEDIVIDIDRGEQAASTEDLDVSECSHAIDTACHVDGIEDRGKG